MIREMTRKDVLLRKKIGGYSKLVAHGQLRYGTKRAVFSTDSCPNHMIVMTDGDDNRMTIMIHYGLPKVYLPNYKDYHDNKRVREEAMKNIV